MRCCFGELKRVSIRALAWRATLRWHAAIPLIQCFNPRPRVEGDSLCLTLAEIITSEHARAYLPRVSH